MVSSRNYPKMNEVVIDKFSAPVTRRYLLGQCLGSGTLGTVFLGWEKRTRSPVVVRKIKRRPGTFIEESSVLMKELNKVFTSVLFD